MKRYAALLLTAALVTSLTACNWDKNMDSSSSGELSSSSGSGMERSMPMNGDQLLENRSLQSIIEDIQAEFEDAVFTYKELFAQDGIEVHYDDGGLEEFPIIEGDPERLKQVFCNLLDNAAKHGGNGGRIDTAIGIGLETVVLTIRDYGPGIPDAELPYIKQKFYKGSSKARGSGIGLAVVEEIVTRHGGRFEIGNAEGGGCIVQIYLPLKQSNS